ncbi:hypothetical protein EYF80_018776 [Liparis tanakae]|uniref:Uncharacterized protein n=1 Tax=Liparis tanakae TaxID=230148 RepID=A0A4Z2HZI4_9TELE|nr:hypothetical protein EYF80_018776 [Liparis tanakae]
MAPRGWTHWRMRERPSKGCRSQEYWSGPLLREAGASWSCSSSSPLVCGRACSRSDAARGDEDEAAEGTEGVLGRKRRRSLWSD